MKFLTPKQVGEIWQVSSRTVGRMCERGELNAVRVGAKWRIPVEEFEAYNERQLMISTQLKRGLHGKLHQAA